MKKIIAAIYIACYAFTTFAVQPEFTVKTSSPAKFSSEVFGFMRKVFPNPQAEMGVAMVFAQLGYPGFDGVSKSDSVSAAFFAGDKADRAFLVCMAADETSIFARQVKASGFKSKRFGKWLVAEVNSANIHNFEECAEYLVAEAEKKAVHDISIKIDPLSIAKLPNLYANKNFEDIKAIFEQVESYEVTLDFMGDILKLRLEFAARSGSDLAKLFSMASNRNSVEIPELSMIPEDSFFVFWGSMNKSAMKSDILKSINSIVANGNSGDILASLSEKSKGTFAAALFMRGSNLKYLSLAGTSASFDEIYKATEVVLKNAFSADAGVSLKLSKVDVDSIECGKIETIISPDTAFTTELFFVKDSYNIQASDEEVVKEISKMGGEKASFPFRNLKKKDWDMAGVFFADKLIRKSGNSQTVPALMSGRFIDRRFELVSEIPYSSIKAVVDYVNAMEIPLGEKAVEMK